MSVCRRKSITTWDPWVNFTAQQADYFSVHAERRLWGFLRHIQAAINVLKQPSALLKDCHRFIFQQNICSVTQMVIYERHKQGRFCTMLICLFGHEQKKGLLVKQATIWTKQDARFLCWLQVHILLISPTKQSHKIKSDLKWSGLNFQLTKSNLKRH